MIQLIPALRKHFDPLTDHFEIFAQQGIQVEGWFKGELLLALTRLHKEGQIADFDREVKVENGRVDLTVTTGGQIQYVEIKHWLIGTQKGYKYHPSFYFPDANVGVLQDVKKLSVIRPGGSGWLLILLTANPGDDLWSTGVLAFNAKFPPLHLTSETFPADFSPAYFLGLLKVSPPLSA